MPNGLKFLEEKAVRELIGKPGRSTIWRWERLGLFPKRRKLGPNRVGWVEAEVEAWLRAKARLGRGTPR
jgi:prophage regulatory protein